MKLTREALEAFRDTVLHQRGALAENGMTNDQVNDVLSEFDACFDTAICQSAGAVAPGECGSVPFTFHELDLLRQWFNAVTDLNRAYLTPDDDALMLKIALLQHGMQPPNNQPNSDHVAVTSAKPESRVRDLLDDDGENRAVRTFLMLYGASMSVSTQKMRYHLASSGFEDCWPDWAAQDMHLTKGGAQNWLRYLFALESGISSLVGRPNEKESLYPCGYHQCEGCNICSQEGKQ